MYATKAPPSRMTPTADAVQIVRRLTALKTLRNTNAIVWHSLLWSPTKHKH